MIDLKTIRVGVVVEAHSAHTKCFRRGIVTSWTYNKKHGLDDVYSITVKTIDDKGPVERIFLDTVTGYDGLLRWPLALYQNGETVEMKHAFTDEHFPGVIVRYYQDELTYDVRLDAGGLYGRVDEARLRPYVRPEDRKIKALETEILKLTHERNQLKETLARIRRETESCK